MCPRLTHSSLQRRNLLLSHADIDPCDAFADSSQQASHRLTSNSVAHGTGTIAQHSGSGRYLGRWLGGGLQMYTSRGGSLGGLYEGGPGFGPGLGGLHFGSNKQNPMHVPSGR